MRYSGAYRINSQAERCFFRAIHCSKGPFRSGRRISSSRSSKQTNGISSATTHLAPKSFAIGSLAGLLGSLAGMGGGFVMIPLMTGQWIRLSQHQAHGTSLFAVAATGLAGAASYQDQVQWPEALAVTATAMITSRLGAQTTVALSARTLKRSLGVLMLCMAPAVPAKAYYMEKYHHANQQQQNGIELPSSSSSLVEATPSFLRRFVPPALVGLGSGYLSGLFGVGGGVIVVPALTLSCPEMTHTQALATSLAAMALPAIGGTYTHYINGTCALSVAPYLALGALTGAYLGGRLSLQTDETLLRWGFSGLLTTLGIRTLLKA